MVIVPWLQYLRAASIAQVWLLKPKVDKWADKA
uniref:Uncharacterized protein n=1 Tax=Candidozyma auris TaxID=498019 RepID=A0A0L0P7J8_CANAR